jgi:predicted PurR-regulated permease PerM
MAVLISFLMLLIVIAGFVYLIASAVMDAAVLLVDSAPYFLSQSIYQIQQWIDNILAVLPTEMQQSLSGEAIGTGFDIGQAISDFLKNSVPSIPVRSIPAGVCVCVASFVYLIKDMEIINIHHDQFSQTGVNSTIKAAPGHPGTGVAGMFVPSHLGPSSGFSRLSASAA